MAAALERALGPAGLPELPEGPPEPVLVLGPAGSGRTALLLRAALAGGAHGPRALFLAPSAVPRLPSGGGAGTDPRALQRLELRYPRSRGSLCRLLGSLWPRPPELLLLHGLERYLGGSLGGSPGGCARLAALLLETTRPPQTPRVPPQTRRDPPQTPRDPPQTTREPPQVVVALRLPPPAPHVLPTLLRFFPARCRLRPRPGGVVGVRLSRPGRPTRCWRIRLDPRGEGEGEEEEGEEEEEEEGGEGGSDTEEEWG